MKGKWNTLEKGFEVAIKMGMTRFIFSMRSALVPLLILLLLLVVVPWLVVGQNEALVWQESQTLTVVLLIFTVQIIQHIYRLGRIEQKKPKFYLYQNRASASASASKE